MRHGFAESPRQHTAEENKEQHDKIISIGHVAKARLSQGVLHGLAISRIIDHVAERLRHRSCVSKDMLLVDAAEPEFCNPSSEDQDQCHPCKWSHARESSF